MTSRYHDFSLGGLLGVNRRSDDTSDNDSWTNEEYGGILSDSELLATSGTAYFRICCHQEQKICTIKHKRQAFGRHHNDEFCIEPSGGSSGRGFSQVCMQKILHEVEVG